MRENTEQREVWYNESSDSNKAKPNPNLYSIIKQAGYKKVILNIIRYALVRLNFLLVNK